MNWKTGSAVALISAALVAAPLASASARDHWNHGGGGLLFGLGAAVGALAVGVATIATAPLQILAGPYEPPRTADAPPAYAYAPRPAYAYAPPPQPAYYPPPVAYYPQPRPYYYPPPGYAYAPPPGYYYPQR